MFYKKRLSFVFILILINLQWVTAQFKTTTQFTPDGNSYYVIQNGSINKIAIKTNESQTVVTKQQLTLTGKTAIEVAAFYFSTDNSKLLIFTHTAKVWRYNTRGDYWVLDIATNKLTQMGAGKAAQSLMYAKFNGDGQKVGYVSEHNIFSEDVVTGKITQLTFDGTRKLINAYNPRPGAGGRCSR